MATVLSSVAGFSALKTKHSTYISNYQGTNDEEIQAEYQLSRKISL